MPTRSAAPAAEELLRGANLRVTRPRVSVLTAVYDHPHADTDQLIGVVRADLGDVSHQAVYDVLRVLTAAGLGGILIPLALERLGVDPAVSSGPFVTTITDVVGFFSFLGIAALWFGF